MKKPRGRLREAKTLREALEELRLAKADVAARNEAIEKADAEHRSEVTRLTEAHDTVRLYLGQADREIRSLRRVLKEEEIHGREQELNISILLHQIASLQQRLQCQQEAADSRS